MTRNTLSPKVVLSADRRTVVSHLKVSPVQGALLLLPLLSVAMFALLTSVVFALVMQERMELSAYRAEMKEVVVHMEIARPLPSQNSVDLAMVAYGIFGGDHVSWPVFDASLSDRGLTSGATLEQRRDITVGAPAFTSWGVLGSTLGHEIEIHGNQSFLKIMAFDGVSRVSQSALDLVLANRAEARGQQVEDRVFWGTIKAEREAYFFEMNSAKRFGLRPDEVNSIQVVMEEYYSEASK